MNVEKATFAGGCFWCMEPPFKQLKGITEVLSGYTGGNTKNPSYDEVCSGESGHLEAIQINFDPQVIAYEDLVEVFWQQIDPTDTGGQFVDRGQQYSTAIYYHNDRQRTLAEKSKIALAASGRFEDAIVTPILPAVEFYAAEDYHQDFYRKSTQRYKSYRAASGRDSFIEKVWKK